MQETKLTRKQQAFVDEYLVDLNGTQAAIRAGYSQRSAKQLADSLLKKPHVADSVNAAILDRQDRTKITQDYVINTIVDTIERCRQAQPVYDRQGRQVYTMTPTGETAAAYTFDASNVLKGTEQLGRHLKMFTDRTENTNTNSEGMSAELKEKLEEIKAGIKERAVKA